MQPIQINHKQVKMVAHRGAGKVWVENSLPAFQNAAKCSYWGIETDIHCTKDGKFILIHDDNTERVTGQSYVVEETDFETLRNLHLLGLEGDEARLPTLEEYIDACKSGDKYAVLELKNRMPTQEIEKILCELEMLDYLHHTVIISFSIDNIRDVSTLRPGLPTQFLISRTNATEKVSLAESIPVDIDIDRRVITPALIDTMHNLNVKVNAWTVNEEEEALRLIDMGIDYITTDIFQ